MRKKQKFASGVAILTVLLLPVTVFAGCGGETATTGASAKTSQSQSGASDKGDAKVIAVGEKGATDKAEVTVKKITTTSNLDSPEAATLLVTGETGESASYYGDKGTPKSGNEFLMITLNFKNIDAKPPVVNPAGLTLQNSQGKEYQEVSTGGYGGVFNMPQVEPGKERQVTVVYEVPKGESGLTLQYQPYGEIACLFAVR